MVVLMSAMAAPPCWACSCLPDETKRDKAERADVVFTGTVTLITDTDPTDAAAPQKVEFDVQKVYKGYPKAVTNVYNSKWGSMCAASLEVGKRYTVFASVDDGKKWTSMCSGTKEGTIDPDFWGLRKAYPPQSVD
jgi:hypothetical protein